MYLVVADNRTVPYIYLLNVLVAEEDLDLMKYVSKYNFSFVSKIMNYRDMPKEAAGGRPDG